MPWEGTGRIDAVPASVERIIALERHASMSSSYKPALLKALLRRVSASPALEIGLDELGAEFVRLYWVQTVVFQLRQAASLNKEPKVVQAIRGAAECARVRDLARLPADARVCLERNMADILRVNVLEAFHRSAPQGMRPLYRWSPLADRVSLDSESAEFLRHNASTLESVANLRWARYLEKVNVLAPRIIQKVERQGAHRASVVKYLRVLRAADASACFYCERDLASVSGVQIDHVIPWSFLLDDPLWDLVLACVPCNQAKSDVLPERHYLAKLSATHRRRAAGLIEGASPLILPHDVERLYDAALAVEWPHGWAP